MKFADVLGQSEIKKRLIQTVQEERISHAQLFFGPSGVGKLPLAIAYARFIMCENRGEEDACGVCPSCIKFTKLAHPDLHFSFPVVSSKEFTKPVSDNYIEQWRSAVPENPYITENQWYEVLNAENKQGLISKAEAEAIQRKLSLKSYESEFKIMIIWLAEKMNASAANSLLKLLEEPPDKTIFMLISESTDQILPTILSRTQMIRMTPLSSQSIIEGLRSNFPDAAALHEDAARRANGNYSTARQIIESDEVENMHFEEFTFFMRQCYKREIIEINGWIEKMAGLGRERLKLYLSYGLRMIRENFILNLEQAEISYLSQKEGEFSQRFSAFIHQGNVYKLTEEFDLAIRHIEANGNPRLVLLDLAIQTILLLKQPAPAEAD